MLIGLLNIMSVWLTLSGYWAMNSDGESETYRHLLPVPFIATCNLHMNIDNNNDNVVPVL